MNAVRLALGTLTVLPVRAPSMVDRRVAGFAMALAPVVALVLAALVCVPLEIAVRHGAGSPLLLAVLTVTALAGVTRAIHLDGLADVADGLGSGRRDDEALVIMKQSDVGPFGVATLVLALLAQVGALASLGAHAVPAVAVALVVSRAMVPLLCTPLFRAARADGLGVVVAGSVWGLLAVLAAGLSGGSLLAAALATGAPGTLLAVTPLAAVAGLALGLHAHRRFGGVTGDVYGAVVETSFTACLVLTALTA